MFHFLIGDWNPHIACFVCLHNIFSQLTDIKLQRKSSQVES